MAMRINYNPRYNSPMVRKEKNNTVQLKARGGHPEEKIKLYGFSKPEYELEFLAKDIQEKIKKGIKPEEILALTGRSLMRLE